MEMSRRKVKSRQKDSRQRRNPSNEITFKPMKQEEVDIDRFYVIEKLLEKRVNSEGHEEYLVRWKNYSSDWDSWEPRSELERNSLDMVHEFNRISSTQVDRYHCICKRPYRFEQGGMIQCFYCLNWYHFTCLNMDMEEANSYAQYFCDPCREANPERKSILKLEKLNTFYGSTLAKNINNG